VREKRCGYKEIMEQLEKQESYTNRIKLKQVIFIPLVCSDNEVMEKGCWDTLAGTH
jgi:hypothetical protein